MADEPSQQPEDIQGILSELDSILSGVAETMSPKPAEPLAPAPPAATVAPAPVAKPVEPPKPVELPKPVEPVKAAEPPKPVELPKPVEPVKAAEPPKPVELPKPVEPVKAAEPPKPVEAVKAEAPAADDIPASTPKDQIRRIAYVYTFSCLAARESFATFLSQAARTISKKPLYLRQVMASELSAVSDPYAVFEKARDAKAVAVLAVVDGWPAAKIEGLSEACARGGLLFRAVASGDVQKKSTAVDVIVDMMLLPGEA